MTPWPIESLLPHTGRMLLLDAVVETEGERMVCRYTARAGNHYSNADGSLPAWCGIELMAQCVGAWSGWQSLLEGKPVRLGFLLGTRHYRCDVNAFACGSELQIEAVRTFHEDDGLGVFACRIDAEGMLAQASLTVFSPLDTDPFLESTVQGQRHV